MRKLPPLALAFALGFLTLHERTLAAENPTERIQLIEQKLDTIPIGEASFSDASLREIVGWLHKQAMKNDATGKGVNMIIKADVSESEIKGIAWKFQNGTLREACDSLASAAKVKILIEPYNLSIVTEKAQATQSPGT